jgi:hypothetical protein
MENIWNDKWMIYITANKEENQNNCDKNFSTKSYVKLPQDILWKLLAACNGVMEKTATSVRPGIIYST